ncbi:glutamine--fructose-6-phosphate transaminase (isomerizing) [Patescibacteria group bacterium]
MCGIIGYVGQKKAFPFLMSGLKDLEYRGYDSCGVALQGKKKIQVIKTKGEVDLLIKKTRDLKNGAISGIGHTRWATHGKPSMVNAHPHLDCSKKVALVHNGIIENYQELKESLIKKGHRFVSETDTEILVHLIELNLSKKKDLFWAVTESLKKIIGAYGIAVIGSDFPGQIIVAKLSSPLILGFGKNENFIASDQPALLPWTKKLATLKDGQVAKITAEGVEIRTIDGQSADYQKIVLEAESRRVTKAGYPHFMFKEIFDQPLVVQDGLRGRLEPKKGVKLGGIERYLDRFLKIDYLPVVACGTSFHAALVAKYFFQKIANLPVVVEDATELVGTGYPFKRGQPVIFVSQSGETADILAVLKMARKKGIFPLGLVNVAGSSVSRDTKAGVYLRAGYEIGVAATKTFSAQLLAFLLWSILVGRAKRSFTYKDNRRFLKEIAGLPNLVSQVLAQKNVIKNLAKKLKDSEKLYFLGRGIGYALSLEAALKVKEIAYIPAEGLPIGELKHGPLALVDRETTMIFLIPDDESFEKNLNSLNEAAVRGGQIIVLTNKMGSFWPQGKVKVFRFPKCEGLLAAFPMAVWLQLLAYYLADILGKPIDKPRNLAKSVTVE